ncbi:primosomal protein N', partial [Candidatus Saccharibacteria bacterium]|nr:primosomal protein N' [Candidatus Saccharibacteria bacterium]
VLVPEIALTSQLSNEFKKLHTNVVVLHSGLTEAERHIFWQTLQNSVDPWVVVGPRSALFSPRDDFGLVIVDECHEPSYHQDSQPKYNALRVAKKLSELLPTKPKLVLGSATPSVTDYYLATHTKTPIHRLEAQVTARDALVEVVDLKDPAQTGGNIILSRPLLDAISRALTTGQQVLLFHNRRGSARSGVCTDCGWVASCSTCHLPMRLHHDVNVLKCHTCGNEMEPPKSCPECHGIHIDYKGFGTKRIEAEVQKRFPGVSIARFDSDTNKEARLHKVYDDVRDNEIQVIIGTQGIAKGLDLPQLSVVGIIQAESELYVPDFSSEERAFQLITQVIGRAGRRGQKSEVYIQTYNPEHPVVTFAQHEDYLQFYDHAIEEREAEHMPPFTHLLHATIGYSTEEYAKKTATQAKQSITKSHPGVYVRGPMPAFHEHRGSKYYQQLVITSSKRSDLVAIARSLPQKWQYTLDPPNLF